MKKSTTTQVQFLTLIIFGLLLATSCSKESLVELQPDNLQSIDVNTEGSDLRNSEWLEANLSGDQCVPPVLTDAVGYGIFGFGPGEEYLKYELYTKNLMNGISAYIYLAPYGENGPMVARLKLKELPNNPMSGEIASGQIFAEDLMGPLEGSMAKFIDAIKAKQICVVVHTIQNPMGEIRGQIFE